MTIVALSRDACLLIGSAPLPERRNSVLDLGILDRKRKSRMWGIAECDNTHDGYFAAALWDRYR